MNYVSLTFLFLLTHFLSACNVDEIEIGSDCLMQSPPLKQLLNSPVHFGINKYRLISKYKVNSYRFLLISSKSKCNSDTEINRCRTADSTGSQTVFIEPTVIDDTYYFDISLGVGNLYYNLVELEEGKVNYISILKLVSFIRLYVITKKLTPLILLLKSKLIPLQVMFTI